MAKILKGAEVADAINSRVIEQIQELRGDGVVPELSIVRVSDVPDQIAYAKSIIKRCGVVGVSVSEIVLAENVSEEAIISRVNELNDDNNVHGVLILRPLPKHISDADVRAALLPSKDIDGITDISLTGVFTGTSAGFAPCTATACVEILDYYGIDCTGKRAVVIGRSLVVGKPVAIMLMDRNATVTVCHTKTVDIPAITRGADIIIACAGVAENLTGEYFSEGQVVVDVGINWNEEKGKLCGDVKFDEVEPIVAAITPVPGGVGTVTTSVLISRVVEACCRLAERA